MSDLINQISADLQRQIEGFEADIGVSDVGAVTEAGDGIARVKGLPDVKYQELVQFANGVLGTAFNLEQESVGVIVMGDYVGIEEGMAQDNALAGDALEDCHFNVWGVHDIQNTGSGHPDHLR